MTFNAVTPNVFTDTTIRGCNPSYVVTSQGTVVVDTPQMPSKAVAMRKEAESNGAIQRGLAVIQVQANSATILDPAPTRFAAN